MRSMFQQKKKNRTYLELARYMLKSSFLRHTLPIKVCLVKAMVFPVVMYGCESWIVKKAECGIGVFALGI